MKKVEKIPNQEIIASLSLKGSIVEMVEIFHSPETPPSLKMQVARLILDIYTATRTSELQINARRIGSEEKTTVHLKIYDKEWGVTANGGLRHLPSYEEGRRELIEAGASDKHTMCASGCALIEAVELSQKNPHDGDKPVDKTEPAI